jgi:translation initiation factor 1
MKRNDNSTLVYSSEMGGRQLDKNKTRTAQPVVQPNDGYVRLRREVKGRGGGTVIVINGIPLGKEELKDLAGDLKKRCGCGGTVKDGVIEIQGDHRDTLCQALQARGYRVKPAGG